MSQQKNKTLGEFIIENQIEFKYSSGELSRLINSIRLAAKVVNHQVNKAGLVDILGDAGDTNIQGEDQQNWMFMPTTSSSKHSPTVKLSVGLRARRRMISLPSKAAMGKTTISMWF